MCVSFPMTDGVVQLLIKNFDKRGVQIANVSDLMHFLASHFVTLDFFDLDELEHVLYLADVLQPKTTLPICDIKMSQGSDNWTTFSKIGKYYITTQLFHHQILKQAYLKLENDFGAFFNTFHQAGVKWSLMRNFVSIF